MSKSEALDRILKRVAQVARRIRMQNIIEGIVTGGTIAIMWVAFALLLLKTGWFELDAFYFLCIIASLFPIGIAVYLGTQKLNKIALAQHLDRSHNLHDRLSTAVSLSEKDDTSDWAISQIRDAGAHADDIDVKRASPFHRPLDVVPLIVAIITLGGIAIFQVPTHQHPLPEFKIVERRPILDSATLTFEKEKLEDLKKALKDIDDKASNELVREVDELLKAVENKELSEKQFLNRIKEIKKKFDENTKDEETDEVKKLAESLKKVAEKLEKTAAKELKNNKDAQALVKALKEKKLDAAAKALEKLSKKFLDPNISEKELEKLAKLMEKFSDLINPDDPAIKKLMEKHKRTLEKLLKKEKKGKLNSKEKEKLDRAKKALDKLQKKTEAHNKKKSTRELKKLKKMSKQIGERGKKDKKLRGGKGKKKEKNQAERKNFKNESGRNSKKMSEDMDKSGKKQKRDKARDMAKRQLEELKESMKRSRKSGKDGKESKSSQKRGEQMKKFLDRAKGKPKNGKAKEGDTKSSNGKNPKETNKHGKGKGERKLKDETKIDSKKQDKNLKGEKRKGATKSEIIRAASEEGFATTDYKKVFDDYESVVEEVMEKEKIPPGYRYYIKQYFKIIQPKDE